MSGAAVFCDGRIVGIISEYHRSDGLGRLAALASREQADSPQQEWLRELLSVAGDDGLIDVVPVPALSATDRRRSRLTGERALQEHWDPHGRGVERGARPGWFFTGRRQALSELVTWMTAAPAPAGNVRVVTGGVGEVGGAGPADHDV